MGVIWQTAIGMFGALALSFFARDLYACAPRFQRIMLRLAARWMPAASRDEIYNQWHGDLMAMPPSELLRTLYAFDCIRGGITLGFRSRQSEQSKSLFSAKKEITSSDWDALLHSSSDGGKKFYDAIKRATDLLAAGAFMVAIAPMFLLVCIGIKLESNAPILARVSRIGKDGKPFGVYKFRAAMGNYADIDKLPSRMGRFLRRSRLDEIPQMFNVFKGDMSFVGPRPERQEFLKALGKAIPHYDLRHAVKPGVTGWAQVNSDFVYESIKDYESRVYCDVYYAKHRSFWMDLKIMFKTVWIVLGPQPKLPPK